MSAERPKVFQQGTLTVVFGADRRRSVYVGATLLTMAYEVTTNVLGKPNIAFRRPNNEPEAKILDEEMRAARGGKFDFIRG